MKIVILGQAFRSAFLEIITFVFFNMILAIIVLTFIAINGKDLPLVLLFAILLSDAVNIVAANFFFNISTELHLSSKEFIKISIKEAKRKSEAYSKFWKGMKPLRIGVGQVCSFETREFLLFIWGQVVLTRLIDLLLIAA